MRKTRQEQRQKLRELQQGEKCQCDRSGDSIYQTEPSDAEWLDDKQVSGAPYTEYVTVNTWQCRRCGKMFDDASAIA